ncbi:MAG: metal-sensitive transcriptional regulator [Bacillota bacterium]
MHSTRHDVHQHTVHLPARLRAETQQRLAKIEGQVKGLQRMVDDDRYCVDLLTQIEAVRGALRQVSQRVLRNYLENCVTRAMLEGDPKVYDELMSVISRFDKE